MEYNKRGFTLVEILVVTAIIVILAMVIVMVLNPAELLRRARDSSRLARLNQLSSAIGLVQLNDSSASIGNSNTIYLSLTDTTSTCANLGLPSLLSTWSYHCATQSTLTKNDGTGWVPVNFTGLTTGSPFSSLPLDPTNSTSSYFAYVPVGSGYKFSAIPESSKYSYQATIDGGINSTSYEIGNNLSLGQGIVYGSNLVVNGAFSTDLSSWTNASTGSGVTVSWDSGGGGRLLLSSGGLGSAIARQTIATVSGQSYTVSFDYPVNNNIGWFNARVFDGATTLAGNASNSYDQFGQNITGTFTMTFTAISGSATIELRRFNANAAYVDNVTATSNTLQNF